MAELADALDSKSSGRKVVWVRAPPPAGSRFDIGRSAFRGIKTTEEAGEWSAELCDAWAAFRHLRPEARGARAPPSAMMAKRCGLEPPPAWLQISRFPREQRTVAQRLSIVSTCMKAREPQMFTREREERPAGCERTS